jgi:hypothetical protein
LDFDGVDDRVQVPLSADLTMVSGLSISAWVNLDATATGTDWILNTYLGGGYFLRWEVEFSRIVFSVGGTLTAPTPPIFGAWTHISGTFDAATRPHR